MTVYPARVLPRFVFAPCRVAAAALTCVVALALPAPAGAEEPGVPAGRTLRPVTPLMGYAAAPGVDAATALAQADELRASGLAASGYRFVLLPSDVLVGRDAQGVLRADPKRFPEGGRAFSFALRARDLVPGLVLNAADLAPVPTADSDAPADINSAPHSTPNVAPAPAPPISRDADLTRLLRGADLGLLQFDLSQANGPIKPRFRPLVQAARRIRPAAVIICNTGSDPGDWIIGLADAWRVTGPSPLLAKPFERITAALDASHNTWRTTYPGCTPMLGPVRFDGLTPAERHTHLAVWTMLASPLWITGDLTAMDNHDLGLLVNPALVELHQDPLVQPARRLAVQGDLEFWARPLGQGIHSGRVAVAAINRGTAHATGSIDPAQLGLDPASPVTATDLLTGQPVETGRPQSVAPHATVLLRYQGTALPESPFSRTTEGQGVTGQGAEAKDVGIRRSRNP